MLGIQALRKGKRRFSDRLYRYLRLYATFSLILLISISKCRLFIHLPFRICILTPSLRFPIDHWEVNVK